MESIYSGEIAGLQDIREQRRYQQQLERQARLDEAARVRQEAELRGLQQEQARETKRAEQEAIRLREREGFPDFIRGAMRLGDKKKVIQKFNAQGEMQIADYAVNPDNSITLKMADGAEGVISAERVGSVMEYHYGEKIPAQKRGLRATLPKTMTPLQKSQILARASEIIPLLPPGDPMIEYWTDVLNQTFMTPEAEAPAPSGGLQGRGTVPVARSSSELTPVEKTKFSHYGMAIQEQDKAIETALKRKGKKDFNYYTEVEPLIEKRAHFVNAQKRLLGAIPEAGELPVAGGLQIQDVPMFPGMPEVTDVETDLDKSGDVSDDERAYNILYLSLKNKRDYSTNAPLTPYQEGEIKKTMGEIKKTIEFKKRQSGILPAGATPAASRPIKPALAPAGTKTPEKTTVKSMYDLLLTQ